MRHRIIEKNIEERTGVCAVCGPVGLFYRKHEDRYVCIEKRRENDRRRDRMGNSWKARGIVGATKETKERLLEEQDHKCAVCAKDIDRRAHLDHDHKTGKVRGLLCRGCNLGLGHFEDNVEALAGAIKYLAA